MMDEWARAINLSKNTYEIYFFDNIISWGLLNWINDEVGIFFGGVKVQLPNIE